jgi:hypothetical protein
MAEVTINVVESSDNDNTFLPKTADNVDGEIRADSVRDMVDKVLGRLGAGDCIKQLNLIGHGAPGDISVGAGMSSIAGKQINGDDADWEDQVRRLKGKFCEGAELRLLGCNTGVCDAGAAKLHKLANLLGVTVKGTNRNVYPADYGKDGFIGGDGTLVGVEPGKPDPPECLTEPTTDGLKKKKKKDQKLNSAIADQIRTVTALGVRDVRQFGLPRPTDARLRPFSGPAAQALLNLYDFTESYEGLGLAAKTDALIDVLYPDSSSETFELCLDFRGLALNRRLGRFVFLASHENPAPLIQEYLLMQGAVERFARSTTGLDSRGFNIKHGRFDLKLDDIRDRLDRKSATLSATELLRQPVSVFDGVSTSDAEMLHELLRVDNVAALAALKVESRIGRFARILELLAEEERRTSAGPDDDSDY